MRKHETRSNSESCLGFISLIFLSLSINIDTPVYKNIAVAEIYIICMYECQKKTEARWTHITPAPWCGHYLQLFFRYAYMSYIYILR